MKLICGPMATISHPAFRILIEKFGGCDEYFTEMINAGTLITKGPFEHYYLDPAPVPQKVVWQLTSKNGELMQQAAEMIIELPGIGIDLNMGCSAPDIYRYGAGIGWMLKPISETEQMVKQVRKIVDDHNHNQNEHKRLSVKLRLGDDNFTDNTFFSFTDMLVQNGVELLTLHPRTKKEKLITIPRYEYCEKLAKRYKDQNILVYINGNIKDKASTDYAIQKAPSCNGIMISRASVQKPWIFKSLNTALSDTTFSQNIDMQELALSYIDDIEKYQPQEFWKTRLQRFFTYFSMNFMFSHYAQTQFLNASDNDELRQRIIAFFEKSPEERYKKI